MKNFNIESLFLVNPCELSDECYIRAVHANDILDHAQVYPSFEKAIETIDFLVATSSKETLSEKKHLRNPMYLHEFADRIRGADGKVGLVFGREDFGLLNEEISKCDIIVKIPSNPAYKALNLSHSVGIFLYSLYIEKTELPLKRTPLDRSEKQLLYQSFTDLLDTIKYPLHKKEKTEVMFKRLISRSIPSKWEYHTLMGVLKTTVKRLNQDKD
jgi:TrmH family RNA methyltransferase